VDARERGGNSYREHRCVSRRASVVVALLAALAGAGLSTVATVLIVKTGPTGPAGETGPPGPQGPEGDTNVSAEDVQSAVDEDPDAVAGSLSGHFDYEDIQQDLDPNPQTSPPTSMTYRSALDDLCSQLSPSDALSDDFISC